VDRRALERGVFLEVASFTRTDVAADIMPWMILDSGDVPLGIAIESAVAHRAERSDRFAA
jgi:hypothetical protein